LRPHGQEGRDGRPILRPHRIARLFRIFIGADLAQIDAKPLQLGSRLIVQPRPAAIAPADGDAGGAG
jgi:hypothetical protein